MEAVMARVSPTLKVLLEMRDEMRSLNRRVESLDGRVESLESVMKGLTPAVFDLVRSMQSRDDLRDRMEDHERRLSRLERRAG
jgi:hypothetical protein